MTARAVPLLIYDPSAEADATRGTVETRFAELIDLLPTFIDTADGDLEEHSHLLEGRSLRPILRGNSEVSWQDHIICEMDFTVRDFGPLLDMPIEKPRGYDSQ